MAATFARRGAALVARPARSARRRILRQRWDALVNATLVVIGGQTLLIGAGLQLNIISVRRAVEHQRLGRIVLWVFEARRKLSHVRAQELELLVALTGAAFIAFGVTRELAAWYFLTRRPSHPGARAGQERL